MTVSEISAKSLLRFPKKIDSWFLSACHLNLYRGCLHNCIYCDGRAEKYAVAGEFGEEVTVKTNALEILERELDPARRRKPLKAGFLCLGGGVGDAYQPVEARYALARRTLEVAHRVKRPVHILTKSVLVERDLALLETINTETRALVSMSFSSVDARLSAFLEPGVPPPSERLRVLRAAKERGIACGMFLMPVVPFLTDSGEMIDASVRTAKEAGLDFVIFGGMTLKDGRQREFFFKKLKARFPELIPRYQTLYAESGEWGGAPTNYYDEVSGRFFTACKKYRMPVRIPQSLFCDLISPEDNVLVLLEHCDYLLRLQGKKSGLGYAAYRLSQLKGPLAEALEGKSGIPGVSAAARVLAREILATATAELYKQLIRFVDAD